MEEKIRKWNKLVVDGILNSLRRAITVDEAGEVLGEDFVEAATMYYGSWPRVLQSANLFLSPQKLLEEVLEMDPELAEEVSGRARELEKGIQRPSEAERIAALAAACRERLFIRSQMEAEKFLQKALEYWEADYRKRHKELKEAKKTYQHLLKYIQPPPLHDQVVFLTYQVADKLSMSPENVERALEYVRAILREGTDLLPAIAAGIYLVEKYSLSKIALLVGTSERAAREWANILKEKLKISTAKRKLRRKRIEIVERLPRWGLKFIKRTIHHGKIPFYLRKERLPYLWVECYIQTIYPTKWVREILNLQELRARAIDLEPLQELVEVEEGKKVIVGIRPISPAIESISDAVLIEALGDFPQTAEEIASRVGCPKKVAEYRLERLVREGIVHKKVAGRKVFIYQLYNVK